jgi:hypothetical protein
MINRLAVLLIPGLRINSTVGMSRVFGGIIAIAPKLSSVITNHSGIQMPDGTCLQLPGSARRAVQDEMKAEKTQKYPTSTNWMLLELLVRIGDSRLK